MNQPFSLTVLGARGSMASGRRELMRFGGDSSCYMVRAGDETVFLDAGSGLVSAPPRFPKPPVVLLSHLHLDHLLGLGMYPGFDVPGQRARIFVPFCESEAEANALLDRVFSPPIWPLRLSAFRGEPVLLPLPDRLALGDLLIETMEGHHPDRAMIFRLSFEGRSIVYATDYEYEESSFETLADFARGAELLLCDAQFTDEEYPARRGFGHSTPGMALELLRRSDAKRLLLIHHSPSVEDETLLLRERTLEDRRASYAREGMTIELQDL